MRRCWLAILAACSTPVTPARTFTRPAEQLRAASSSEIAMVVVTDDATAAATIDIHHAIRLWPALDGTREPLVVPGPDAAQLALVRDTARDLSLATIDDAGTLAITRVSAAGIVRGRAQLHIDQPVIGIEPNALGFVALLADRTIVLLDFGGAAIATLEAPGRIAAVLTRGTHTLALVDDHGAIVGHWLSGREWIGAATPKLAIDPAHTVLSPDGAQVASAVYGGLHFVELATGRSQTIPAPDCEPLAFVDADTVACGGRRIAWYTARGGTDETPIDRSGTQNAAGDQLVVTGVGATLELDQPHVRRFLGYRTQAPGVLRSTPAGLAMGGTDWFLLDARLQIASVLLRSSLIETADLVALGPQLGYTITNDPTGGHLTTIRGASIADGVIGVELAYEPATHLLAFVGKGTVTFMHVDANGAVGRPVVFTTSTNQTAKVYLLDPALAHGKVAAVHQDGLLYALDVGSLGGSVDTVRGIETFGLRTVDRAGHIYSVTSNLVAIDDLYLVNTARAGRVAPNADGTLVAIMGDDDWLALYRRDGTQVWRLTGAGLRPTWHRGELFAAGETGIVRLDLATGAYTASHCGWNFGLYDEPLPTSTAPSLCDR